MDRFLFSSANPKKLSIYRIITAIILFIGLSKKSRDVTEGLIYLKSKWVIQLYDHFFTTDLYFLACYICLLLFLFGVFPRLINWLLLFLLVPLLFLDFGHFRSFFLMLFSLLCFCFLHHSEYFSIHKRNNFSEPTKYGPIWPIRLMQITLSLVYFVNAFAKSTPEYLKGDVLIGLSEKMSNFTYDFSDGSVPFLGLDIPVSLAAWTIVLIEYFLAFGFWINRLLVPTAIIGCSFHMLMMFYIDIHLLHVATLYLYLSFLFRFEH